MVGNGGGFNIGAGESVVGNVKNGGGLWQRRTTERAKTWLGLQCGR
jgi:hypothetical protein